MITFQIIISTNFSCTECQIFSMSWGCNVYFPGFYLYGKEINREMVIKVNASTLEVYTDRWVRIRIHCTLLRRWNFTQELRIMFHVIDHHHEFCGKISFETFITTTCKRIISKRFSSCTHLHWHRHKVLSWQLIELLELHAKHNDTLIATPAFVAKTHAKEENTLEQWTEVGAKWRGKRKT